MTVDVPQRPGDDRRRRVRRALVAVAISLAAAIAVAIPAALRLDDAGATSGDTTSATDDGS